MNVLLTIGRWLLFTWMFIFRRRKEIEDVIEYGIDNKNRHRSNADHDQSITDHRQSITDHRQLKINKVSLEDIAARLDCIELVLEEIPEYVKNAETSAENSANAAQRALSSFETLSNRLEQHIETHSQKSHIP